jgi:SCY1-like protein 1
MPTLCRKLDEVADDFPAEFFKMKVLPELLKSVEFGGGGAKVFGTVMQIGQKLSEDEYESQITPVVVRLFANPDRGIRVCLLDNLPLMIDHLPQKLVNDKIFPQMASLPEILLGCLLIFLRLLALQTLRQWLESRQSKLS